MNRLSLLASALVLSVASAHATDILGWRNDGNGIYSDAVAPLDWSNPVWSIPTDERSNATPIFVGNTCYLRTQENLHAIKAK